MKKLIIAVIAVAGIPVSMGRPEQTYFVIVPQGLIGYPEEPGQLRYGVFFLHDADVPQNAVLKIPGTV